jgi:NADP-dependent 3-hydroxy acid dehydrogenase YdfG
MAAVLCWQPDRKKLAAITGELKLQGYQPYTSKQMSAWNRIAETLLKKPLEAFGTIDILVNNAGISMRASFDDVEISVLQKLMDVNFLGSRILHTVCSAISCQK